MTLCCLQFDRERIPERVVHARGASAKGFFEVSYDQFFHFIVQDSSGANFFRQQLSFCPHGSSQLQ